jgi:predicted house-cleaning noncanonical NTP pyrophosphatase (MazG superfamily)
MKKTYNKLIRDKFVDIYTNDIKNGISMTAFESRYLTNTEAYQALKDKLREEVGEALASYDNEDFSACKEELADVIEVIRGILFRNGSSFEEVIEIADRKRKEKGGFETGLYLESIDYKDK